jgi:hypothetical protein
LNTHAKKHCHNEEVTPFVLVITVWFEVSVKETNVDNDQRAIFIQKFKAILERLFLGHECSQINYADNREDVV